MTKPNFTPNCKSCGKQFLKSHKRAIYCSLACAVHERIVQSGQNECWEWRGAKNDRGYGQIRWNGAGVYAHRVVCALKHDGLGAQDKVLHSCDNPGCCNPAHLSIGTQADNMKDMAAKGRQGGRKLSESDVHVIRSLRGKKTRKQMAEDFGVTVHTVSAVLDGNNWRHV